MSFGKLFQKVIFTAGLIFLCVCMCNRMAYTAGYETDEAEQEKILNDYYNNFYENIEIESLEEELDAINKKYGKNSEISFEAVFQLLMEGKVEDAIKEAATQLYGTVLEEMQQKSDLLIKLVLLVIVAAIFNTYSSVYKFSYVGEQGFFVTYLMIAMLLIQSFAMVYEVAEETVCYLKELMECMLPALYISLLLCSGLTTSHMINTTFLWMLSLVERFLLGIILPGIRIYFFIVILNQISAVDRFSKLAGLLKQALQFLLKAVVTGIVGLNVMKGILIPVYDNAKYNALQKGLAFVPGGSTLTGLSSILVGAGVLIKNSIGVTVVIILLLLGSVPLLEILCFYVVYKVILALVQPISDTRILAGIQGAADSTGILLRATTTSIVLSVLSVAVAIMTTNIKLYAG